MKPHLIPTEKLQALEDKAGEALDKVAAAAREAKVKDRWRALDRLLTAVGVEISGLLIILLALAILCAPVGLGLAAIYFLATWMVRATGSEALGWIVAILTFVFLCRYVWGTKLQRASRRAAEALIASKAN
jgi:Flp pilus assembly protein TadB